VTFLRLTARFTSRRYCFMTWYARTAQSCRDALHASPPAEPLGFLQTEESREGARAKAEGFK